MARLLTGLGLSLMVIAILNYSRAADSPDGDLPRFLCAVVIGVAGSMIAQGIDRWVDRVTFRL